MTFYETVLDVLKHDDRFFSEDGELLRNAVVEASSKMDAKLIKSLLENDITRERFFTDVDGIIVFDKVSFGYVVNNREFLPDSYTRYKNMIGLTNGRGEYLATSRDVELVFPYKDCVLEGGQTKEDQKRPEIFYNETLAPDEVDRLLYPKVLTNAKRMSYDGDFDIVGNPIPDTAKIKEEVNVKVSPEDNIIIKGNNLLAISSLLETYENRINCIYIDPPFNTGNDSFNYNDRFSRASWLVFMKDRLKIAKRLLANDGNIFIHIDINQSHYLKVLADEIFSEDNFVEEIIWAYGSPSGGRAATPKPVNVHDYILHYAKNYSQRKQNRVYVPYSEKYISDWFKYEDDDGRLYQRRQRGTDENGKAIWTKQYLDESKGVPLSTVWKDVFGEIEGVPLIDCCEGCKLLIDFLNETKGVRLSTIWSDIQQVYADPRAYKAGNKADVEVIKEFNGGQKPEALIKRVLDMATDEGDIVLDFHLGTGTTAAVAHKMNRRYIGIEQMDSQIEIINKRMKKTILGETAGISKRVEWMGGGSFVYCELAKLNQWYADRIRDAKDAEALVVIYEDILKTGFISYKVNPKDIDLSSEDFNDLSLDEKKKLLVELLDKNQLYINYCDMEDETFEISEEDKAFTKSFYGEVE